MLFLDFEKPIEDLNNQITKLKEMSVKNKVDVTSGIKELELAIETTRTRIYANLTPWQRVQLSRHPERPYTLYYIEKMCDSFYELHGDRQSGSARETDPGAKRQTLWPAKPLLWGQRAVLELDFILALQMLPKNCLETKLRGLKHLFLRKNE
jgi:hypothetical protein